MSAYCHITGSTRAALVFPSGHKPDRRPYVLRAPSGATVHIDIVELDSTGTSIAAWHAAGRALAQQVTALRAAFAHSTPTRCDARTTLAPMEAQNDR